MQKRTIISIILTMICIIATNKLWLIFKPMPVSFNMFGNGEYKISVFLNKKDNNEFKKVQKASKEIELTNEENEVTIKVKRAKFPKRLKLVIMHDIATGGGQTLYVSNFQLNKKKIEFASEKDFSVKNATIKVADNKLYITPINKDKIEIIYNTPLNIRSSISFKFHIFLFFLILPGALLLFYNKFKSYILYFCNCKIENLNNIFLPISVFITALLFITFLLSFIGFIFHIPIQKIYIYIAFIIASFVLYLLDKKYQLSKTELIMQCSLLFFIFIISGILAFKQLDYSWDGRTYHQHAIILFMNGWNPVYSKPLNILPYSVWVECYTKLSEIITTNFSLLINNIEFGKIINYLFSFNIFCLSFYTFNKFKNLKLLQSLLLSLLVILNPVCICQIGSFYVDLLVHYLFVSLIFVFILKEHFKTNEHLCNTIIVMNIVMLSNVKFGGLLYSLLFLIAYFIYSLIIKNKTLIKQLAYITLLSTVLIFLSGINPYVTNVKQGFHPLHPLAGEKKIDIMTCNSPESFEHKSPFYKLFISTFSNSENILYGMNKKTKLKIPFSLKNQQKFTNTDIRIAGFGYFWSGILILLLILTLICKNSDKTPEDDKTYYFVMTLLWLSILLNPEAWWARYVPQFWCIPIFIIAWRLNNISLNKYSKTLAYILTGLLLINSSIINIQNFNIRHDFSTKRHYFFKQVKNKHIYIYKTSENFTEYTLCYKLKKQGTTYTIVNDNFYLKHKKAFHHIPYILDKDTMWTEIKNKDL